MMHLSLPNPMQRERVLLGKLHWELPLLLGGNRIPHPRFHPLQARIWLTFEIPQRRKQLRVSEFLTYALDRASGFLPGTICWLPTILSLYLP